jgi:hypothetical protein
MLPVLSCQVTGLGRSCIFVQLCLYANDVHTRLTKGKSCQWHVVEDRFGPPDPPPPYTARYCNIERYTVLLQLYDASGRKLLAERMYLDIDMGTFFWATDSGNLARALMYESSDSGTGYGEIALPPTLLDRVRAALP